MRRDVYPWCASRTCTWFRVRAVRYLEYFSGGSRNCRGAKYRADSRRDVRTASRVSWCVVFGFPSESMEGERMVHITTSCDICFGFVPCRFIKKGIQNETRPSNKTTSSHASAATRGAAALPCDRRRRACQLWFSKKTLPSTPHLVGLGTSDRCGFTSGFHNHSSPSPSKHLPHPSLSDTTLWIVSMSSEASSEQ